MVPDLSCTLEQRAILTVPPEEHFPAEVLLHDFSTSTELIKGVDGLDVQGFTYLKHHSKILELGSSWDSAQLDQYYHELEAMMCERLGARKAFIINTVVRRVSTRPDPRAWVDRDSKVGKDQESRQHEKILVAGSQGTTATGPVGKAHIDLTLQGMRNTVRFARKDIAEWAQDILRAEDAGRPAPRYAIYSAWRPLRTVERDPMTVCDYRTVDPNALIPVPIRFPSELIGEFTAHSANLRRPASDETNMQKWFWLPNQTPEDLLVIKNADTSSDHVAAWSAHAACALQEAPASDEPRESVDCRVLVFW
ncbi:GA4 desaturase [Pyrenophora seminiperda CCB06]|uniref:GA4 desaturase n=1 Tax=Pyrenophora seminiperda CCB06 TaxID=1302712 RepID=A0A3M7LVP1_9PLEO|nr:GA4 desaturase [Pyrenophora seminiperda CCB06]